jgi:hypothetical protein
VTYQRPHILAGRAWEPIRIRVFVGHQFLTIPAVNLVFNVIGFESPERADACHIRLIFYTEMIVGSASNFRAGQTS